MFITRDKDHPFILFLCFVILPFPLLGLSLSLSLSVSLSLCVYLYLYLYLSLHISIYLSFSISLSPSLSGTYRPFAATVYPYTGRRVRKKRGVNRVRVYTRLRKNRTRYETVARRDVCSLVGGFD